LQTAPSFAEDTAAADVRLVTEQPRSLHLRYSGDGTRLVSHTQDVSPSGGKLKWRAARSRQLNTRTGPTLPPPADKSPISEPAPVVTAAAEEVGEEAPEPEVLYHAPLLRQPVDGLRMPHLFAQQPPLDPQQPAGQPDTFGNSSQDIEDIPLRGRQSDPCAIDPLNRIHEIGINIAVTDPSTILPPECPIPNRGQLPPRDWYGTDFYWKASGLCHKPLYFEQVALERYGHSWAMPVQAVFSGAHFFATVPILPYKMGMDPPWECQYALGYYRPGNCAPFLVPAVPISVRGGLLQAGVMTGGVFLFP